MFDFPTVPTFEIKKPLKEFYNKNEDIWLADWLTYNLGTKWEDYVETNPKTKDRGICTLYFNVY